MSQKSRGIGQVRSQDSRDRVNCKGNKPMIMIRQTGRHGMRQQNAYDMDDVNPDPNWSRLEKRFADAPISRGVGFLALAAVSLDLRLLEHWRIAKDYLVDVPLRDPVDVMRKATLDPDMQERFETRSGKMVSAANIQHMLTVARAAVDARIGLPEDERKALWAIGSIADDMGRVSGGEDIYIMSPYAANADKLSVLRHYLGDQPITSDNSKACLVDIMYDRVIPLGIGGKRRKKYAAMRQFDDKLAPEADVAQMVEAGDQHTRAFDRGEYVRHNAAAISRINWSNAVAQGSSMQEWPQPYGTAA
jgi:hypothetical protein